MACASSNKAVVVLLEKYLSLQSYSTENIPANHIVISPSKKCILIGTQELLDSLSQSEAQSSTFKSSDDCFTYECDNILHPRKAKDVYIYTYVSRWIDAVNSLIRYLSDHVIAEITNPSNELNFSQFCECREIILRRLALFLIQLELLIYHAQSSSITLYQNHIDSYWTDILQALESFSLEYENICHDNISITTLQYFDQLKKVKQLLRRLCDEMRSEENNGLVVDELLQSADVIYCTLCSAGTSLMTLPSVMFITHPLSNQ
jgi:hypothetical protein